MLTLVPKWASEYGEFWRAIRSRNLWFIKLRYAAVIILLGFLFAGQYIFQFEFTETQIRAILIISGVIFIYNYGLYKLRHHAFCDPNKFNCMHISLIQMALDLTALMILVYYTGTIDSPLYMLFIFHMIFGSLILPEAVIFLIAGIVCFLFALMILLEKMGFLERHLIAGLLPEGHTHTISHDILFLVVFSFVLIVSVYIANKIAHQLYKMEFHLRDSLEKLNESEIAKQKYTIGIVHEIKTPINAVMSILELIHHRYIGPISSDVDDKIIRAEKRTAEALELINNVLHISKLKLLEIKCTDEIDVRILTSIIIDGLVESFQNKKVKFDFNDNRCENKILKSDKVLLELAIANVLTNAVKYVNENGKINFELNGDSENLEIKIIDNGIGIPRHEIEKVFEQFYRASNISKTEHEGSGLGLSLVKEIIEKLGGKIQIYSPSEISEPGKPGTTVVLALPYYFKKDEYDIFEVNDREYLSEKNIF